jgi:hypothetical protein
MSTAPARTHRRTWDSIERRIRSPSARSSLARPLLSCDAGCSNPKGGESTEGHAADVGKWRAPYSHTACTDWRINRDCVLRLRRAGRQLCHACNSQALLTFNELVTHSNTSTTCGNRDFAAHQRHGSNARRYLNIQTRRQRWRLRVRRRSRSCWQGGPKNAPVRDCAIGDVGSSAAWRPQPRLGHLEWQEEFES